MNNFLERSVNRLLLKTSLHVSSKRNHIISKNIYYIDKLIIKIDRGDLNEDE